MTLDVSHIAVEDLTVNLVSPEGTRVPLIGSVTAGIADINGNGGDNDIILFSNRVGVDFADIDLVLEWTGLLSIPLPVTVGVGVVASVTFVAAALIGVRRDAVTTERTDSRTTAFRLVR